MSAFMEEMRTFRRENQQVQNVQAQAIAKLEIQMGQIANTLNQRPKGKLPSQPVTNPKGQYGVEGMCPANEHHEQVQAITLLRSGKTVDKKVEEKMQN